MSFNLQKYLIENNLTLVAKVRLHEDEDNKIEDKKQNANNSNDINKYEKELKLLRGKAKDVIFKYTEDTPQGRKLKGSIDDYKMAIGDIPNKIKQLQQKIDTKIK